ncbi:hypothetical protein CC80DRAFT_285326 [Byssothecium circinans]|uniref:Dystroglycan-type cadherin-like domain-containing protein n=1 Tax=Byssothecium circinans TaxID=147558 RepID=A0A6A5U5J5_9PLEO|nr:hypothetical protein CC80DRAFT_285326 [Byssothecium circinans]
MAITRSLDTLFRAKALAFITLIATATASPQINYPLNLQLPPVAKVGEAYSFQFASTTFQSVTDKLQYSLVGSPSWLHISSNNRTLWGTPGSKDGGTASFTITAAGEAGAVANMDSKLLVANDGPKAVGNVSQYLSKTGTLSGPSSVVLLPSKPFEVKFEKDMFDSKGTTLTYYATSADHTPLPAWISFDAQSLRFAGTTPFSPAPQSFDLLLIASDAPGYAAASISFTLDVSNHQLLFRPLTQTLNMSKGDQVQISGLKSMLFLDNSPIRDEDLQSASADLPSWLSFDERSFDITGTPPSGLMSQDLSITVRDKYGDTSEHGLHVTFTSKLFTSAIEQLNITLGQHFEYTIPRSVLVEDGESVSMDLGDLGTWLHVTFTSKLFTSAIEQLNITLGQHFEYTIPRSVLVEDGESVSMDLGDLGTWLHFDPAALTIAGTIPNDVSIRDTDLSLTATSSDGKLKDTQTFHVQISSGSPSTDTRASQSDGHGPSTPHNGLSSSKKVGIVVGSVVAGLVLALILVAIMFLICRRKKQEKGYISPRTPRCPRKADISRPIPNSDTVYDFDLEKGKDDDTLERTPEHPPQLNLILPRDNLQQKRKETHSLTSSVDEAGHDTFADFSGSVGLPEEAGPSHRPHDSMKIATEMARGSAASAFQQKKRTAEVHRNSSRRSSGLPAHRRLTSIGHGRIKHTYSPSRSTNDYSTNRRSVGSSSWITNTMSMVSTVHSVQPQPTKARHTTQFTTPLERHGSIRPVPTSSTSESLVDRRNEKLLTSYMPKSRSAKSPFFKGANSRVSSGSQTPATPTLDVGSKPDTALTPKSPNIAKTNDVIIEERTSPDLPESLRIRRPSDTPSPIVGSEKFPGSLRSKKSRAAFKRRQTEALTEKSLESVEGTSARPETTIYSRFPLSRRENTRDSLRATELKSSLNEQLGTKVFKDDEISDSEYSDEEGTIVEAENRRTIKLNEFTLPPLDPKKAKKNSRRTSKEGKRDSTKELKRISQRDPTPFSLSLEHGGKENQSSSYSLNFGQERPTPARGATATTAMTVKTNTSSPSRPKTSVGIFPVHARTVSRTVNRISTVRNSQRRPLSRENSTQERHSRKSIHSRTQSRQSTTAPGKHREHSRTQSGAYPHFDASTLSQFGAAGTSGATADTKPTDHRRRSKRESNGSQSHYNRESREVKDSTKRNSGAGTHSSKHLSSTAREAHRSRIAQLQISENTSPFYHANRDSAISSPVTPTPPRHSMNVGLGLSLGNEEDTPARESVARQSRRERTPLSVLDDGNGGSPERVRGGEASGKGKAPVTEEIDEGIEQGGDSWKGRWGSFRWRSGGGTFWGKNDTAFI